MENTNQKTNVGNNGASHLSTERPEITVVFSDGEKATTTELANEAKALMEKEEMTAMRKRVEEIRKPYVMKNGKHLFIIYKKRVEIYTLDRVETKKEIDEANGDCSYDYEDVYGKGWNKEHEEQMNRNNGFRHVQLKENVETE